MRSLIDMVQEDFKLNKKFKIKKRDNNSNIENFLTALKQSMTHADLKHFTKLNEIDFNTTSPSNLPQHFNVGEVYSMLFNNNFHVIDFVISNPSPNDNLKFAGFIVAGDKNEDTIQCHLVFPNEKNDKITYSYIDFTNPNVVQKESPKTNKFKLDNNTYIDELTDDFILLAEQMLECSPGKEISKEAIKMFVDLAKNYKSSLDVQQ